MSTDKLSEIHKIATGILEKDAWRDHWEDDYAGGANVRAGIKRIIELTRPDAPGVVTAWAVLDMDGGAFHSVHIFKEDADRASFGLGSVVPLHYYEQ